MRKLRQVQAFLLAIRQGHPGMTLKQLMILLEVAIRGDVEQQVLVDYLGLQGSSTSKNIAALTTFTAKKVAEVASIASSSRHHLNNKNPPAWRVFVIPVGV